MGWGTLEPTHALIAGRAQKGTQVAATERQASADSGEIEEEEFGAVLAADGEGGFRFDL